MTYHFYPEETLRRIEPEEMGLRYTSAQRYLLHGAQTIYSDSEESCLVVLAGEIVFHCGKESGRATSNDMLYLPLRTKINLEGEGGIVMRFGAPCARKTSFSHILFSEVDADDRHKVYGKAENGTRRDVWNFIDEKFDSSRFLVGICQGAPGAWTAWPPHIHGKKREEVYVYFQMGDGFGIQCVYQDMSQPDTMALVQDYHLISIPDGYHPNAGCPKSGLRYVYCMVSVQAEDRQFMDLKTQEIYGSRLE